MISFWAVFINDLRRTLQHKSRIILFFILMTGAVTAAVFLNTKSDITGNVAFISQNHEDGFSSPYLNIIRVENIPPLSDLVSGKYDAVIVDNSNGGYDIQTIKNDDFKSMITTILSDPSGNHVDHPDIASRRKAGTNITGFLTMFIMMQGVVLMYLFAEDKERGQIKRVASSPVSFTGYLCAHSLFTFFFLLIPSMVILYVVKFILGVDIGFSFWEYLFLISIICALSASFALLLNTIINRSDSANMIGSAVVILTSVLAGSFYSFDKGNRVLEMMIRILPQKSYLVMAGALENGSGIQTWYANFIYLIALILFFFLVAVIKTRKAYTGK